MNMRVKKSTPQPLPHALAAGVAPRKLQATLAMGLGASLAIALATGCASTSEQMLAASPRIQVAASTDDATPMMWAVHVPAAATATTADSTSATTSAPQSTAHAEPAHAPATELDETQRLAADARKRAEQAFAEARAAARRASTQRTVALRRVQKPYYSSPSQSYIVVGGGGRAVQPRKP